LSIIEAIGQNEFSDDGLTVINQLLENARAIEVTYPELKKLESVKFIQPWLKQIFNCLESEKRNTNPLRENTISELQADVISLSDKIDPLSMHKKNIDKLIKLIYDEKPILLDKALLKLISRLKLFIWIKQSFDLLGKDLITMKELKPLKEE